MRPVSSLVSSNHPALVLASSSPRRSELLRRLGVRFTVIHPAPGIEEQVSVERQGRGSSWDEMVCRIASVKAKDVLRKVAEASLIIAADTVVVCDGTLMGKPSDPAQAKRMLYQLSGKVHTVFSGVVVLDSVSQEEVVGCERTEVTFRSLDERDIGAYLQSGEPFDKAGGYGIQGRGSLLVERIEGCYFNVVGLPLKLLDQLIRVFGVRLLEVAC